MSPRGTRWPSWINPTLRVRTPAMLWGIIWHGSSGCRARRGSGRNALSESKSHLLYSRQRAFMDLWLTENPIQEKPTHARSSARGNRTVARDDSDATPRALSGGIRRALPVASQGARVPAPRLEAASPSRRRVVGAGAAPRAGDRE